jgi:hypothetical protein
MQVPGIPFTAPFAVPFTIPLDIDWFAHSETVLAWLLVMVWLVGGVLVGTLLALLSGGTSGRDLVRRALPALVTPERIHAWRRSHRRMPS